MATIRITLPKVSYKKMLDALITAQVRLEVSALSQRHKKCAALLLEMFYAANNGEDK